MDERWKLARVSGWGPDFTDVIFTCSEPGCPVEYTWPDGMDLGEIVRTVQQHLAEEH